MRETIVVGGDMRRFGLVREEARGVLVEGLLVIRVCAVETGRMVAAR